MIRAKAVGTGRMGFEAADDEEIWSRKVGDVVGDAMVGDGEDVVAPGAILLDALFESGVSVGSGGVGVEIGLEPSAGAFKRVGQFHGFLLSCQDCG